MKMCVSKKIKKRQTICVATICYNSRHTISQTINSVLSQKCRPDEYLIVDGGSSDGTIEIAEEFSRTHSFIKVLHGPDRGISHGFNRSWQATECEFVCFLNSDDLFLPSHLDIALRVISQTDADIFIPTIIFDMNRKRQLSPKYPNSFPIKDWRHPRINHPGMIVRKDIYQKTDGFDEQFEIAMDVDFFYKALRLHPKICSFSNPTIIQFGGGLSQKRWLQGVLEMRTIEIGHGRNQLSASISAVVRALKMALRHLLRVIVNKLWPND